MRYEVWKIKSVGRVFVIEKKQRINLRCRDDEWELFEAFRCFEEDEAYLLETSEYEYMTTLEDVEMLTWFEIPSDEEEEYEDK